MNNKTTNTLVAYTQLLGTFYSIPPLISTTEISTALLGCLHLIRSHVGNVLSEHRQKLFVAIKDDPIRWVQLAIPLEKRSIYTEALVHLIGAYPKWRKSPCYTALPEYLLLMIVQKTKELRKLRTEIERDMLLTTLRYGPNRAPLDPTEREQTETWITVQIFRDQLAQRIYKLDRDSNGAGIFFRELHKRTLEALDIENVREMCQGTMHSDWKELNADLKDLKDYVGELVEDLARNELMIEPDAHGVGYLTCAKIDDKDIPWSATVES
ncbi:hypothetical protein P280DRAFT_403604 [Massarina eburnea CBS 473.64]|uniref:Uncharacterized protein n=1 Tax=Massarina eburnea CBS 473.64 TaxID=1395130 RepID=A0A6A6RUS1_9PLEO|nr:hypothetical protein P280DRAFT_403604 [Massarina eburnea CBS 473.64]